VAEQRREVELDVLPILFMRERPDAGLDAVFKPALEELSNCLALHLNRQSGREVGARLE